MQSVRTMNGWKRLWVVTAILALLYALIWANTRIATSPFEIDKRIVDAFSLNECKYIVTLPSGFKLDREPEYNSPCYGLYTYRYFYSDAATTATGYIEHLNRKHREAILFSNAFALGIWLVTVLLLYAGGATVAWVRAGFQRGVGK